MLAYGMYAALCMKGCCLLAYTRMLSALKLLCSALFGTWAVFVYTRWRLACCMYVVLKLLRSALRVYEAPLVSCARAGVLHLGIPIRPCCVTVTMLLCLCIPPSKGVATSGRPGSLHTCEYSVGMYVLGASTGLLRACDYIVYLPINGIA